MPAADRLRFDPRAASGSDFTAGEESKTYLQGLKPDRYRVAFAGAEAPAS
jgi:hypothetical protein